MTLTPLPNYFIIKSPIKDEKEKREMIGRFYIPPNMAYMERNLQFGIIEAIGSNAEKEFPQAKIGDLLIVHHFVQGNDREKSEAYIQSDEEYNYYMVTVKEYNGRRNECYGLWNGETIIPNKEFIFLECEQEKKQEQLTPDEFIGKNTKKEGSLIVFSGWTETREDIEAKIQMIKAQIKNISKSKMTDTIKAGIAELEYENEMLTRKLSKKHYAKYKVLYANPESKIQNGDTIFGLSIAGDMKVGFMGKEYRIMQTKYVAAVAS